MQLRAETCQHPNARLVFERQCDFIRAGLVADMPPGRQMRRGNHIRILYHAPKAAR